MARQRERAGKDVQNVRLMKDEYNNVLVNSEAASKRWKEYFEKLMNEENDRKPMTKRAKVVNKKINCFSREVKNVWRRMKMVK